MTTPPDELMETVRRELASWHTIHPTATFAEMESAVEAHLHRLRAALLEECTEGTRQEDYPACPHCGARMAPVNIGVKVDI